MAKNLRWKVLTIVGVVALAIWSFYPPDQKVKLGLDLKGGVHLVLRVQTDDALRLETQTTADRLSEQLKTTAKIAVGGVTVNDAVSFSVTGVSPEQDAAFRNALTEVEAATRSR
jgi:preprotein translocase subunit SecD